MKHLQRSKASNIYNILPRPAVSCGLIVIKLKRDVKYGVHVYFRSVRRHIIFQTLGYLKSPNLKSFLQSFSQMGRFLDFLTLLKLKEKMKMLPKKICFSWRSLNMHRTISKGTTLISEIPNIIKEENVIIAPGQRNLF